MPFIYQLLYVFVCMCGVLVGVLLGKFVTSTNRKTNMGTIIEECAGCPLTKPPKQYEKPSLFRVEHVIAEGRTSMNVPVGSIPAVCVLDSSGEATREIRKKKGLA